MKGKKFEVELENGEVKEATIITRIKPEDKDYEYIYYAIEDDGVNANDEATATIYASKLIIEEDKNYVENLEDEAERQYAYKLFSETYKTLREEKQD